MESAQIETAKVPVGPAEVLVLGSWEIVVDDGVVFFLVGLSRILVGAVVFLIDGVLALALDDALDFAPVDLLQILAGAVVALVERVGQALWLVDLGGVLVANAVATVILGNLWLASCDVCRCALIRGDFRRSQRRKTWRACR